MRLKHAVLGFSLAGFTLLVAHVGGQAQQPPAPGGGVAPAPAGRGQGRGQAPAQPGRRGGRATATYPAQQREPGDPEVVARGKTLYEIHCQICHSADLRGGEQGGPSLLRSQIVLSDKSGELISPVIRGSLPRMPAIQMSDADAHAISEYIHAIVGTSRGQGMPPTTGVPITSIVVGDAAAGKAYVESKCLTCHSLTGDLAGIGGRMPDAKVLQNLWVSGGAIGGTSGRGRAGAPTRRTVTVTVTLPGGEKVEGPVVRIDDFLVTVRLADGTIRSFRRDGDTPKVEIHDPMEAHRNILRALTDKDVHDVTAYLVTVK